MPFSAKIIPPFSGDICQIGHIMRKIIDSQKTRCLHVSHTHKFFKSPKILKLAQPDAFSRYRKKKRSAKCPKI